MEINNSSKPIDPSGVILESTPNPINNQRGSFPIILGVIVLVFVIGGGAYYLGIQKSNQNYKTSSDLSTDQSPQAPPSNSTDSAISSTPTISDATLSPSTNKIIPKEILSELPAKSPDGKEVLGDSMPNNEYLIYRTFVKERGAGKEYDYWVFIRTTKTSINLSDLLRQNKDFIEKYKDSPSNSGLFLTFYSRWVGENPAFSIANGWEIVGEYWVYDLKNASFYYYPRKD